MNIPIRAVYKRSEGRGGGRATLEHAEYAQVPAELVMGTLAQAGMDAARHAGDIESAEDIARAITRAEADGKIMTL